jgi:3-methylcrotonyl-CoA carboxylase alpha subunit
LALTRPIRTVLIGNRGEIAVRIARTCRAMGIRTIAVYSDVDADAVHVRACDEAVRIGPAPARQSYLCIDRIVDAAKSAGAQAIHPGYGFLSENADFADACGAAGLIFIGPPASAMRAMGDKIAAKKAVASAGVPTVPGYLGEDQSDAALGAQAAKIGAPVLVKAAAGGGGKGMRVVSDLATFADALAGARREAAAAFGDDRVFLERYLASPRHIEIQVLADSDGGCIHLGERECSIQRRHQKVLEETPSTAVSAALRAEMGDAAVRAAVSCGYVNAGTVEFMLDGEGRFYFLEMNARLQVEHPITEAVTGVDLVREQVRIAEGAPLGLRQSDIVPRGHAIEVRIYAEDAEHGFLPSVGRVTEFSPPQGPGIRNDAGVAAGSVVSVDYDPMLAKLIAYDRTRDACMERLAAALDDYFVGGLSTNIPFLRWIVGHEAFRRGETTTAFIERYFTPGALRNARDEKAAAFAAAAVLQWLPAGDDLSDPWGSLGAWRHAAERRTVSFAGVETGDVVVERLADGSWRCSDASGSAIVAQRGGAWTLTIGGTESRFLAWRSRGGVAIDLGGHVSTFETVAPPSTDDAVRSHRRGGHGETGSVDAPMSGKIVKVEVREGDAVVARQVLLVMEAMKMEHTIVAPYDGAVVAVHVKAGDVAAAGDALAEIEVRA